MSDANNDVEFPSDVIAELYTDNPEQQLHATRIFRRLVAKPDNHIDKIIQAGIVPKIVEFLQRDDNASLQSEAADILINITSGTSLQTKIVIEAGAVPIFIRLLDSKCEGVQEQSVWALGNIAGDCPEYRDYVLDQGILTPLFQLLSKSCKISTTRNISWVLSNLCRAHNSPPKFEQISPCLPVLYHLLFHCDSDVLQDACWALSYILDGSNDRIQDLIEAGVCGRLVVLLQHNSHTVVSAALRAVGNIVTGDDVQKQVILNCNALPYLLELLCIPEEKIRKDACWTISNITAGNGQQIQAVIDANVFPALIEILTRDEFEARKEAASVIANATSGGSPQQVRYLVEQGCIPPLCELLTLMDAEIIQIALNGLENILRLGEQEAKATGGVNSYAVLIKTCSGSEKIEDLQSHENKEICDKACDMNQHYFDMKEEEACYDLKRMKI